MSAGAILATGLAFSLAIVAVLGGLAWFFVSVRSGSLSTGPLLGSPKFVVLSTNGDDSCTKLLDYCQRVTCTVSNVGNAAGTATVIVSLQRRGRSIYTHTLPVRLEPGDSRTVQHEFKNASLFTSGDVAGCEVR